MTVRNPPLYLEGSTHPAEDFRSLITETFGGNPGVLSPTDLYLGEKSGTPNMSVDVADGSVIVSGTEATYQGNYLCQNRGVANLTVASSDPTNARKDLIIAKVEDSDYSGAVDTWSLAIVTGTAAATPLFPARPNNSFVLGVIDVAASASSIVTANITDIRYADATDGTTTLRNYGTAAGPGAVSYVTSDNRPASPYVGQKVYDSDTGYTMVYVGSTWELDSHLVVDSSVLTNTWVNPGSTWTTVLDKSSTWVAPCAGTMVTTLSGLMGYNTGGSTINAMGLVKNAGGTPQLGNYSEDTQVAASTWHQAACSLTETYASGASMGYLVKIWSQAGNSGFSSDVRILSTFYPAHLFESL